MTMNVFESEYAGFLEGLCSDVIEHQPKAIGFCAILPDGCTLNGYFNANQQDKAIMAHTIYSDAIFEIIKANAGYIVACAEEEDRDDEKDLGSET